MTWLTWLIAAAVLVAAGFLVVALPRWRAHDMRRRTAWSAARAAIESASVSRDAAAGRHDEAEQLLTRAESIAAHRGGTRAARSAQRFAEQADALWRAVPGG